MKGDPIRKKSTISGVWGKVAMVMTAIVMEVSIDAVVIAMAMAAIGVATVVMTLAISLAMTVAIVVVVTVTMASRWSLLCGGAGRQAQAAQDTDHCNT